MDLQKKEGDKIMRLINEVYITLDNLSEKQNKLLEIMHKKWTNPQYSIDNNTVYMILGNQEIHMLEDGTILTSFGGMTYDELIALVRVW